MHVLGHPLTRRTVIALALGALSVGTAGAGTIQRLSVSQTSGAGSLGSTAFLNTSSAGAAVQAQVGPSTMTSYKYPFGLFGVYNGSNMGYGVVGLSTTSYGVVGESSSSYPSIIASAQGSGSALEAITPANSSATTLVVDQLSSGYGANVFSQTGTALWARAGGSQPALLASSGSGTGVDGSSSSATAAGIYGHGNGNGVVGSSINSNSGVVGTSSANGNGVTATSATGFGLFASVSATAAPAPTSAPGQYAGSYAQSANGPGAYGVSGHNTGTPALYGNGSVRSDFYAGVYGYGNDGPGIYAFSSNDFGALVTNNGAAPTLYVNADAVTGADLIDASAGDIATDPILFRVTSAGNLSVTGSITYGGTSTQMARTRSGANDVATYSAQQSEATVEDVGTAQLVNGSAAVAIAADFRDTIDPAQRYQVFLTPAGDNRGLYVASRTPAGFVVREAQGGRSSLLFDYRIVARPYGRPSARLPHVNTRALFAKGSAPTAHRRPGAFDGTTQNKSAQTVAQFLVQQAELGASRAAVARGRGVAPEIPANLFPGSLRHGQ